MNATSNTVNTPIIVKHVGYVGTLIKSQNHKDIRAFDVIQSIPKTL